MIRYLGIPYLDGGRDRSGIDCWGLVLLIYAEHGIELNPLPGIDRHSPEISDVIQSEREDWIRVETPQPGDVVLFKIKGRPAHVGIVLPGRKFIHSQSGTGSCIENLAGPRWSPRIAGFFRSPGGFTFSHGKTTRTTPPTDLGNVPSGRTTGSHPI